jgi:hypothetical protein
VNVGNSSLFFRKGYRKGDKYAIVTIGGGRSMSEFFSVIFSAIAAIASIISIYYLLTSKPKLRVFLNSKRKELTVKAGEVHLSTLRIKNLRNITTELFRVIIEFPSSFELFYPPSSPDEIAKRPEIAKKLITYIPKDFNTPLDIIEPRRFITQPQAIIRNSKVIFERKGILPWNLAGYGYFDFFIVFKAPNEYKKYNLKITVQTSSKTFIKNFNIKVIKNDKGYNSDKR